MKAVYLQKDRGSFTSKILVDMAYLVTNKMIRLPKIYFEEGLYLPFKVEHNGEVKTEKYFLTRDKIKKTGDFHYYFDFPFRPEQVEI